ncbi:hypothetical protein BH11PLA2_BH11PLA2_11280 [soil metagenome]
MWDILGEGLRLRFAAFILVLSGIAVAVWAAPPSEVPAARANGNGVASCAAAGCHGGGEVGNKFSEQSTWASGDPHAKAYRVLYNDESATISRNLKRSMPAWQDKSCLACHTSGSDECMTEFKSDGVGCDGCHGASQKWIAKHYEPGWKTLSDSDKSALGFRDTKSLVSRITACASCHIGDAGRDVNHDLIAAGHPRLAFEYTRFHFQPNYTKHWKETLPNRDFEVRAWMIGQLVNLRAALNTTKVHADAKWPDFSEQSCFACHQSLKNKLNATNSVAEWQAWNLAMLEVISANATAIFPGAPPLPLDHIRQMQTDANSPSATAKLMAGYSRTIPLEIDAWLAAVNTIEHEQPLRTISDETLLKLAHAIAASGANAVSDWDAAAPHYLALAALHHADPKLFATWLPTLTELRKTLKYKDGYNSPVDYDARTAKDLFDRLGTLR